MNTRRFILRLAVGLLAFLIGVSAAWALGGFNPFQRSSGTRYYRQYRRCGHYRSWADPQQDFEKSYEAAKAEIILLKGPRGLKIKRELSELPPPPPAPVAPMAQR